MRFADLLKMYFNTQTPSSGEFLLENDTGYFHIVQVQLT